MPSRKSHIFLSFIASSILLLCVLFTHSLHRRQVDAEFLAEKRAMVQRLGLSDMCLFTDARYSRHPSVADLNTPFQDYPMSFEHFPSGSILSLPPHLKQRQ